MDAPEYQEDASRRDALIDVEDAKDAQKRAAKKYVILQRRPPGRTSQQIQNRQDLQTIERKLKNEAPEPRPRPRRLE